MKVKQRWANIKSKRKITGYIISGLMIVGIIGTFGWFNLPVPASAADLQSAKSLLTVDYTDRPGEIILNPSLPVTKGLIFYPDARIDPTAYAHRLSAVAQRGVAVVIVKPLFNYPLWDWQTVAALTAHVKSVNDWYVAGHGAGGIKACQVAGSDQQVKGLVLMASYCANNIASFKLPVLSLVGANDTVTPQQAIQKNNNQLPAVTKYQTIDGLTHAGFGNYGKQAGDGELQIDDATAQQKLADVIGEFVGIPSQ